MLRIFRHFVPASIVSLAAGDVPTQETMAAVWLLRRAAPGLRVRVVNVVDLFTLQSHLDHPHGFDDDGVEFAGLKAGALRFELVAADLIEERLGHLAAGAIVDTNEQNSLFHVRVSGCGCAQHPGSRMQRQANMAAAAPSGGAIR